MSSPGEAASPTLVRVALARVGEARIRADGTSMMPTIRPATTLTIERRPFADVRTGDIVAYQRGGRVIVHRVVECEPNLLRTLGDGLPLFDPPVYEPAYLGVVTGYPLDPPPRAVRLPDAPVGPDGGTVTVWVVDPDPAGPELPPGMRIRQVSTTDIGGTPFGGAAGPGVVRVGVSPAGAMPAARLLDILLAARSRSVHILVGCEFGRPGAARDGTAVLAPGAADLHVRPGAPLRPADHTSTVRWVAATVRHVGPATPVAARTGSGRP